MDYQASQLLLRLVVGICSRRADYHRRLLQLQSEAAERSQVRSHLAAAALLEQLVCLPVGSWGRVGSILMEGKIRCCLGLDLRLVELFAACFQESYRHRLLGRLCLGYLALRGSCSEHLLVMARLRSAVTAWRRDSVILIDESELLDQKLLALIAAYLLSFVECLRRPVIKQGTGVIELCDSDSLLINPRLPLS